MPKIQMHATIQAQHTFHVQYNTCCYILIQITFEGIRGSSFTGDIAIDDVSIVDEICPGTSRIVVLCLSWLFMSASFTNSSLFPFLPHGMYIIP